MIDELAGCTSSFRERGVIRVKTHVVEIDVWDPRDYAFEDEVSRAFRAAVEVVDDVEDGLELVIGVDESFDGPVALDVVDLELHAGYDAEVVAGALEGPKEVGVRIARSSDGCAVCEDDFGRYDVVEGVAMAGLEEAVTAG